MYVSCCRLVMLLVAATALAACDVESDDTSDRSGDDTRDASAETDAGETPADVVTASLAIPADFDCAAVLVGMSYFASASPTGMPAGIGDRVENPDIVPGEHFQVTSGQAALEGDYYLTAVVYCDGGGNGMAPVAGVDWVGLSEQALTLGEGTGTVSAGVIPIVPAE